MITILAFFFVLSLLVLVHELGHFTVAKISGIGVHRFSIGYPPRLVGFQIGETDYCISAIPFGGYVKLFGQDDFGDEEEFDENPRDYRSKSSAVKIAVLVAGSLMNLLTAVLIFSILFFTNGVPQDTTVIGKVTPDSMAYELALRTGDTIMTVDGKDVERFEDILLPLYMEDTVALVVDGESGEREIVTTRMLEQGEVFGILPYHEAKVASLVSGGAAETAGFQSGDIISAIDDVAVDGWYHMSDIVRGNPGHDMIFTVTRDGQPIELPVIIGSMTEDTPDGESSIVGKIGVYLFEPTKKVGLAESVVLSFDYTYFLATNMLDFFGKLVTGRMSSKLLGGPVMIAQLAGESAKSGFTDLMGFTAFISINLGVLNLLPFPVLDGGHIFILLIESTIRRKVSPKIKMALQQAGSLVLLLLMLYITFNDVMRFDTISNLFGGG